MSQSTERGATTMADDSRMALSELLRKAELERDADFPRDGVRVLSQALMEQPLVEAEALCVADGLITEIGTERS
jgi:hypothetical protein